MSLNYNYQKISQYINSLDRQINQVRLFGKKLMKCSEVQQKNQLLLKCKDKLLKKQINNIDYLIVEKQQHEKNSIWIKNHLQNWIETSKQLPKILQQKAKKLQSKRLNKVLKHEQIQLFKTQIMNRTVQHRRSLRNIIKTLSQWNVKNCCGLIENLTVTMQTIRKIQKKSERPATVPKPVKNQKL